MLGSLFSHSFSLRCALYTGDIEIDAARAGESNALTVSLWAPRTEALAEKSSTVRIAIKRKKLKTTYEKFTD